MTLGRRRSSQVRRVIRVLLPLCVSAAVLAVLAFGYGPVPALGPALDPGRGVWTSAAGGEPARSQTLSLPGLGRPVQVSFTGHGVGSVRASSDHDLFLAFGYLHARFRLAEMDLERRLGEGRLAQLAGPSAVASDKFELRLGLLRTAEQEWAQTPRASPTGQALLAYSRGVNDYLAQDRRDRQWPALFSLAGVYPANWTPVDSLVIQGDLTQELDFTSTPLDYALLERTLGAARTMSWFPIVSPDPQNPYDPGPYRNAGIAPIAASTPLTAAPAAVGTTTGAPAETTAATDSTGKDRPRGSGPSASPARSGPAAIPAAEATAASALLAQVAALPAGQIHAYPDSNAWAANGPAVAGGTSMLAGDPHLPQTIPSVWYQVALSAPGLSVSGVSVPGLPGILLGHNQHIAWSLTDTQNQAALFYTEQTSKGRPGEYFWRGAWRRMRQVHYTIDVRGGSTVHLTVGITVHGPIMTRAGQTTSVDWMGNLPSPDLAVMLAVNQASDYAEFRAALANWRAPSQNFVYADDRGNIGAISAGYYPVVRHGDPWLPMPGTGADDVAGVIPYQAVPQVYDPPGHVVATANQRPVGPEYPYYIGTTANFFDPGYRAGQIYALLRGRHSMTPAGFAAVQANLADPLAPLILPNLLAALNDQRRPLGARQRAAASLLAAWPGTMSAGSAAASVWWTFWTDYLSAVFEPWWSKAAVPVRKDRAGLKVSPGQFSLDEVLESWTLSDPANSAFTAPGGRHRTAPQVMRTAFDAAVAHLAAKLGGAPSSWTWGRLHSRQFPSLTQAAALGYGPRPAGGDQWTVDAADGYPVSRQGPSWRMIVRWTGPGTAAGEGIYPGGQSENPASPWYEDQVGDWWNGRYLPMPPAGGFSSGVIRWTLHP
ncbi:MAG TPA: penicillin acylase family protein [Streptosporangiaceae bacterium]|nr:penicillin acylase family protein [Streptosporangiaceae bacterium]